MAFLVKLTGGDDLWFAAGHCPTTDDPLARSAAKQRLRQNLTRLLRLTGLPKTLAAPASFSHLPGNTWAAVAAADCRIGIDAAMAVEFPAGYPLHRVFRPAELDSGLSPACLWSLKEAVAKAAGCGFDGLNPLDIRLWLDRSLATIGGQAQPNWRLWSRRLAADAWVAVAMAADRDSGA